MNQQLPARQGHSYKDVSIAQRGGGGMLLPQTFGECVAFSEIMARAQHAIPKHLRDVPGACLAVMMQAMRWELDPFAVASKSYSVKDIIAYEAQLIAAVVHTRAPLKTRPNYTYSGEGQDRRCTVSAMFDDGVERSYESPRIGDITVKNSPLWKADPDQQLGYFSIRSFARRYCPEVILGVYTPEEAETFRGPDNARDVTPRLSLADRLATAPQSATDGFSQQHVIAEIDGADKHSTTGVQRGSWFKSPTPAPSGDEPRASDQEPLSNGSGAAQDQCESAAPPAPNSSQPESSLVDAETDKPAADTAPRAAAGTDPSELDAPGAEPSLLKQGWQQTYLRAMARVSDKANSLKTRHTEALQAIGGKANAQEQEWISSVYRLKQRQIAGEITADQFDADVREMIDG